MERDKRKVQRREIPHDLGSNDTTLRSLDARFYDQGPYA
jgi:hypothetical protein